MVTIKELVDLICAASDRDLPKVGVYEGLIVKSARKIPRLNATAVTFQIITQDFEPADLAEGLATVLLVGRKDIVRAICLAAGEARGADVPTEQPSPEEEPTS